MHVAFFLSHVLTALKHSCSPSKADMHRESGEARTRKGEGMAGELMTAEELAERLAVSPRTVIEWAKSGRIPEVRASERIRRFDYEDVVAALKKKAARHD
jgi:excisionase family DNA binding protein